MSKTVTMEFDPGDYIEDISDELILREYERRNLMTSEENVLVMMDVHEALLRNRPADALATLERVLYPKWSTLRECWQDYNRR